MEQTTKLSDTHEIIQNLKLTGWKDKTEELESDKIIRAWDREDMRILVIQSGKKPYMVKKVIKGEETDGAREALKTTSSESKAVEFTVHMAAGTLGEYLFGELDG